MAGADGIKELAAGHASVDERKSLVHRQRMGNRARAAWGRGGIFITLLAFAFGLALATDDFLTTENLLNLSRQAAVLSLLSLAMLIVMVTGNIDLTVGTVMGLTGAIMAGTSDRYGVGVAVCIGFGVGVVIGLINGFLTTRGRNLSVIVTLGTYTVIQGLTLVYTKSVPIFGFPEGLRALGNGDVGPVPTPAAVALTTAVLVWVLLTRMRLGRELFAVGGNAEAARLSGIRVQRTTILAFVLSACVATLAGLVLIGRLASAAPTAGVGDELNAIGAVLIGGASLSGGAGKVPNVLCGVLILALISNGMNLLNVDPQYQYAVKGGVILLAVMLDQWERAGRAEHAA